MRTLTGTTPSKVVSSFAVWFVVFLILVGSGFSFEDGRWATPGGLLLALAVVLSVLLFTSDGG